MAFPTVTYTFANSTTADATQVNTNFTDLISALSNGTKDISVNDGTFAGAVAASGRVTGAAGFGTSSVSVVTATNGGSSTVANTTAVVVLAPASTIASYSLTLPASPFSGMRLCITSGGNTITALTLAANSGHSLATGVGITTIEAGQSIYLIFFNNVWYRLATAGDSAVVPTMTEATNNSSTASSSSSTFSDVTNQSVTITALGGPVFVGMQGDRSQADKTITANIGISNASSADQQVAFAFLRGATEFFNYRLSVKSLEDISLPASVLWMWDLPSAGSHTYKLQFAAQAGSGVNVTCSQAKIVAIALPG